MNDVVQSLTPQCRIPRREQYRSMILLAAAHSPRRQTLATRGVDEVRITLRRHDRIEWFMRLWCRDILYHAQGMPRFSSRQRRRFGELRRALHGVACSRSLQARQVFLLLWWRLSVAASWVPFLAGSMRRLDLGKYCCFEDALGALGEIVEKTNALVRHQHDVHEFGSFSNGWKWFRCAYDASPVEGRLMGHCGNRTNRDPDCELLSLREPVTVGGVLFWRPHLTFTLSKGLIGEMKGRGNAKPGREYHPYILDLLLNPLVRGFSANLGALPGDDFELSDLDSTSRLKVLLRSPSFEWVARDRAMMNWRARQGTAPGSASSSSSVPLQARASTSPRVGIRENCGAWFALAAVTGPGWLPIAYLLWHQCIH